MKAILRFTGGVATAALVFLTSFSLVPPCCAVPDSGEAPGSPTRKAGAEAAKQTAAPRTCALRVEGMTCGGCVRHVEKALAGVEGVRKATVDYDRRLATVEVAGDVTAKALCDAVKRAGFAATPLETGDARTGLGQGDAAGAAPAAAGSERLCLRVAGMTCEGCRSAVRKALLEVEGVTAAQVDLAKGAACVTREGGKASSEALVEAVARAGGSRHAFKAEPVAAENALEGNRRARD